MCGVAGAIQGGCPGKRQRGRASWDRSRHLYSVPVTIQEMASSSIPFTVMSSLIKLHLSGTLLYFMIAGTLSDNERRFFSIHPWYGWIPGLQQLTNHLPACSVLRSPPLLHRRYEYNSVEVVVIVVGQSDTHSPPVIVAAQQDPMTKSPTGGGIYNNPAIIPLNDPSRTRHG